MYATIDLHSDIIPSAEAFLLDNDRNLYRPFLVEIEKFCESENVMLGGKVGAELLVGGKLSLDSYSWALYCGNTYTMAKRLADKLAAVRSVHVPADTVEMETIIRHREFIIRINTRIIARLYAIGEYKRISLDKFIRPVLRDGPFSQSKIRCIPDELQIIDIYRTLYTPARIGDWPAALASEDRLFAGARAGFPKDVVGGTSVVEVDTNMLSFIKSAGYVIIGDYAVSYYLPEFQPGRLQIIVDNLDIPALQSSIERAAGGNITIVKHDIMLPNDFQTVKHSVMQRDRRGGVKILMDVFNSACFEMIPYIDRAGARYGSPWVLMRFLFIDIWISRMLAFAHDNPAQMKIRSRHLMKTAISARTVFCKDKLGAFQLENYYGIYTKETVEKKKLVRELGERFPMYYPVLQQKSGGDVYGGEEFAQIIQGVDVKYRSRPVDLTTAREIKQLILMAAGYSAATLEDGLKLYHADMFIYQDLQQHTVDPPGFRPYLRPGPYYSVGFEHLRRHREASATGAAVISLFGGLRAATDPAGLVAGLAAAAPAAVFLVKEYNVIDQTTASIADFDKMIAGDNSEATYLSLAEVDTLFVRAGLRRIWAADQSITGEFLAVYQKI